MWADLNSGMDRLPDLVDITTPIRLRLNKKCKLHCAIAKDHAKINNGLDAECVLQVVNVMLHVDVMVRNFVAQNLNDDYYDGLFAHLKNATPTCFHTLCATFCTCAPLQLAQI